MIHFIVFSKDRPLQLQGCLASLTRHVLGSARIDVLVRISSGYEQAYLDVAHEFPSVGFTQEMNFPLDLAGLTSQSGESICFMCDDVITQRELHVGLAEDLLTNERIIGVSLRLGREVQYGMFGGPQSQPIFEPSDSIGQFLVWDMDDAQGDWCYPWDVLGTIYPARFVQAMWPTVAAAPNPSQFEQAGSTAWRTITPQRRYACWPEARTVVPTINVVQDQFANGVIGGDPIDPRFLLECWNNGMRLDIDRYTIELFSSWRIGDLYLKRR